MLISANGSRRRRLLTSSPSWHQTRRGRSTARRCRCMGKAEMKLQIPSCNIQRNSKPQTSNDCPISAALELRSEERREGKSVDLGGRRIIKKKTIGGKVQT